MFGRTPRDTGLESERNNNISAAQKLWLLNSSQLQHKIAGSRMVLYQSQPDKKPPEIIHNLYLGILSRFPTAREEQAALPVFNHVNRRQAVQDLTWALLNTTEFLYRH